MRLAGIGHPSENEVVVTQRTRVYDDRDLDACELLQLSSSPVAGVRAGPWELIYLPEHDPYDRTTCGT